MDFQTKLKEKQTYIDEILEKNLPNEDTYPAEIFKAMRYSVFAGGKRLRPLLLLATCEAVGGNRAVAEPFACAIECIHTYSLIHDDLPAMDNDDYRRGKLTNHKMFGEDIAILAGDGLLHYAMEIMTDACCKEMSFAKVKAMQIISHCVGIQGMLSGQVVDVISEGKEIDVNTLNYIHEKKTAAMIQGALQAGAILGGANDDIVLNFKQAGEKIGVAFQIQDDILDVISTQDALGKPINSDVKNHKTTYVTMFGIDESQKKVNKLLTEAIGIWEDLGEKGQFLIQLTNYIMRRSY